jgi:hypothetical protein
VLLLLGAVAELEDPRFGDTLPLIIKCIFIFAAFCVLVIFTFLVLSFYQPAVDLTTCSDFCLFVCLCAGKEVTCGGSAVLLFW